MAILRGNLKNRDLKKKIFFSSIIVPSRYRNIVDSGNYETAEVIMEHLLEINRLDISDGLGCKVKPPASQFYESL